MIGGSLLAHYCQRAVALMHATNAAAKLGGTASPMRGKRRSWPELVVDLRDQGTGVLCAVALGRRWGGSLDLRSEKLSVILKLDQHVSLVFVLVLSARMLINPWVGRLRLDVTGRPRGEGDATLTLMSSFGDVWRIQGS